MVFIVKIYILVQYNLRIVKWLLYWEWHTLESPFGCKKGQGICTVPKDTHRQFLGKGLVDCASFHMLYMIFARHSVVAQLCVQMEVVRLSHLKVSFILLLLYNLLCGRCGRVWQFSVSEWWQLCESRQQVPLQMPHWLHWREMRERYIIILVINCCLLIHHIVDQAIHYIH